MVVKGSFGRILVLVLEGVAMIASSPVFLSHVPVMANSSHSCSMMSSFIGSVLFRKNCTLAIVTGSAPSCARTNSTIVLYRVEQRLMQLTASDTSNVMVDQFLPSVGHHVMWVQVCHGRA